MAPVKNAHGHGDIEITEVGAPVNADAHLPIAGAARTASWHYAAFHNVTAIVGSGVLALPNAMAYLRWGPGVLMLILSWVITLFTLWQMVEMHEGVPGERFDRYHELGEQASKKAGFGPRLGRWIVIPLQLVVEVSVDVVYMVTAGKSLQHASIVTCGQHCLLKSCHYIVLWIAIFAVVLIVLAQLPDYNAIAGISLAAAVLSVSYSTIAWSDAASHHDHTVTYGPVPVGEANDLYGGRAFGAFTALGTIAFAYAGHNVVLEIQSTLPSSPKEPSKVAMWRGVKVAYAVVAACYFPVALIGYWAYGGIVSDDLLTLETKPAWLVIIANMMVVGHCMGSYQIYAIPVYDMLELTLINHFQFKSTWHLRLITRSSYVVITMFVAMTLPFFSPLLGFFGGFAYAPTTYILPSVIWLILKEPRRGSFTWILNWAVIIFSTIIMFLAAIGGLRAIIRQGQTYSAYCSPTYLLSSPSPSPR